VAEWHYRRGLALEQQGDTARAEEDYAQAVRLDPTYQEHVVPHKMRHIQIVNRSGQKLRVHLRYESQGADGRWGWLPGKGDVTWELPPGAVAPGASAANPGAEQPPGGAPRAHEGDHQQHAASGRYEYNPATGRYDRYVPY
jgi:hypothetical protein